MPFSCTSSQNNKLFCEGSQCFKSLVICDSRFESQIAIAVKSRDLEHLALKGNVDPKRSPQNTGPGSAFKGLPGLLQHVLTILVFWSRVLLLPRLPPSSRSLRFQVAHPREFSVDLFLAIRSRLTDHFLERHAINTQLTENNRENDRQ